MGISHKLADWEQRAVIDASWEHGLSGKAIVDGDGRFRHANPAFCSLLEYTESELQTKKLSEIALSEDASHDEEMARRVRTGEVHSYDMIKHYVTKTRRVVRVVLRVVRIEDEDGEFHFFFSQVAPAERVTVPEKVVPKAPLVSWEWFRRNIQSLLTATAVISAAVAAFFGVQP